MRELCYLNGDFLPLGEAKVSVLDRGFLFGDGVYEVVPVYGRAPFRWEHHLRRLGNSLAEIRLGFDTAVLEPVARRLIEGCDSDNQALYVQITRGFSPERRQRPPATICPTVFLFTRPIVRATGAPVRCVGCEDFRWRRGHVKCTSLVAAVILADFAGTAGADEVVLFRDGVLTEGYSCNYVAVRGGRLCVPRRDELILHGVTYQVALEVAEGLGLPVVEGAVSREEVVGADELFLASSLREMAPVTHLDDAPIGDGGVGPVFRRVWEAWQVRTGAAGGG